MLKQLLPEKRVRSSIQPSPEDLPHPDHARSLLTYGENSLLKLDVPLVVDFENELIDLEHFGLVP